MNTAIAIHQTKPNAFLNFLEKTFAQIEWFRVKNHLRTVEQELRRKKVDFLSLELRHQRNLNLKRLNEYWINGLYPKNTDFFGQRVPYFKDASGTPCAMAYLIEQSGRRDLVNTVALNNNHVYIDDIHDGPVLDWIHKSGLTKAEAARVQPTYAGVAPCGFGCSYQFFQVLSWIVGAVGFILLEWLSYKISWLPLNGKKRMAALAYFTINNFFLCLFIRWLVLQFY